MRLGMLYGFEDWCGAPCQAGGAVRSSATFDLRVEATEIVDAGAERAKISKELEGLSKAIASKEKQLGDRNISQSSAGEDYSRAGGYVGGAADRDGRS